MVKIDYIFNLYICVFLFSDVLFLQFSLIILLGFLILMWDTFFIIINAILYLFLISTLSWLFDSDIYINFLIIIDLGVFFIMLSFLVNFISLFQSKRERTYGPVPTYLFLLILLSFFLATPLTLNFSLLPLQVTFYNWYSVNDFTYFTDLQLLSDLYYLFYTYEFLIMNFYLYLAILALYVFQLFFNILKTRRGALVSLSSPVFSRGLFMRVQDIQNQTLQKASVRVWSKKKFTK